MADRLRSRATKFRLMARINLLPWRAQRRRHRQRQFLVALGASALAAVLVTVLIGSYFRSQIAGQEERNRFLRQKIAEVHLQIDQVEALQRTMAILLKRQQILEDLQTDHAQTVHLFDTLARTIPDEVVLTSIVQQGNKLTLEGRSRSNAQISDYLRALAGAGWVEQPELSVIESLPGDPHWPLGFRLGIALANPNARDQPRPAGAIPAKTRPTASPLVTKVVTKGGG